MGNEQSSSDSFEAGSFNSSSTSKPIATESVTNSPRLIKNKTSKSPMVSKIVVVTEGVSEEIEDKQLKYLESIPVCYPLTTIPGNFTPKLDLRPYRLNSKNLSDLCFRYQEHLRVCSENVVSEQNSLGLKVKEIEATILNQYTSLTEKRNKFAKYSEQIQKVNEILLALTRIHNTLENAVSMAEKLNCVLPEEEQLEQFACKINPNYCS